MQPVPCEYAYAEGSRWCKQQTRKKCAACVFMPKAEASMKRGYHQLVCIVRGRLVMIYKVTADVADVVLEVRSSKAGVAEGVGSCVHSGTLVTLSVAGGVGVRVGAAVVVGICVGIGVVPVDAGVRGAGVEERVWAGEGVGSVVLRQRSLSVSFGFFTTDVFGISCCDCWKLDRTPLDSSDDVSLPSGVESESKRWRGERRFCVREAWSSCSPSTLGLGRFFESRSSLNLTLGSPEWGPAALRTEE